MTTPEFRAIRATVFGRAAGAKAAGIMRLDRPDVPIFLLSSIGDATTDNIGFGGLGFSGVFQKPVNFDMLLAVMRRLGKS